MERIKQALDKARAERVGETVAIGVSGPAGKPVAETAIEYSQTKVQALDPATLKAHCIASAEDNKQGQTAYKMLRTQVMQRMSARGWNALAITSPAPEDGKTVTAINLAISLAREMHHTVLLVDMDLRNPSVHRYLGLQPQKGIDDYLLREVPMSDVLVNPGIERLVLLPGRTAVENSSEILASPSMGRLVQELKSRYPSRIVIFDLPPLLAADDALSFAPYVDAFLLVFRDGKTTKTEVEHSMEILKDVPIIGTVLNGSDERLSAYY
ncbi:MAG: CpsD/CapB family tyrosine-protein kinase [Vicinamibacterales bacterium]